MHSSVPIWISPWGRIGDIGYVVDGQDECSGSLILRQGLGIFAAPAVSVHRTVFGREHGSLIGSGSPYAGHIYGQVMSRCGVTALRHSTLLLVLGGQLVLIMT